MLLCELAFKCVCVVMGVCVETKRVFLYRIFITLHSGSIGPPYIVYGVIEGGVINLNVLQWTL